MDRNTGKEILPLGEQVLARRQGANVNQLLQTAGVSAGVAQELQMPMGPQILEDVEEPMPARPATLRDPGTPRSDRHGTTV